MKQRTRFSGLLAILCLLAVTAAGQSYTIHFIKGTERINHQRLQTANNLEELTVLLSDCRHQLATGEYTVSLTALQSVSKRYDPAARELAKEYKAYVIKIDPDVPVENEDFRRMLEDFGFRTRHGGKNFEAIQPKFVFRLWLNGRTEDEIMASFHQKWRYNIRLAVKKGVEVRVCGKEMVPDFARIMLTTGVRDGFVTRPPEYFANMLDNLGEHARLYMAFHEGQPIAGTLAIHYGDKVWYLYGASSNEHRNLMPNYLLQWSMIQWAVETGCSVYDFRGVSGDISEDNPLYGLYKFKKGFGGDFTEFVGEYDLVLKRTAWLIAEKGSVLYKNLNAKLYLLKNRKK